MVKTLLIMRHGKSRWDKPGITDLERGLKKRGKRDALRMGKEMAAQGLIPDLVLSSPARRARATARHFIQASGGQSEFHCHAELYECNAWELLKLVRTIPKSVDIALLVGHNPSLEEMLWMLTRQVLRLPTAAIGCIRFIDLDWAQIGPGSGLSSSSFDLER